jgi:glycosyltransferase involved in cell wall biosynthesis
VEWIAQDVKPDVIALSNALLMGLVPALRRETGAPIICGLQGEDAFLDTLVEPYRTRAWDLVRQLAPSVARFVSPSKFYAEVMARRMGVPLDQITVVYNGLNFEGYERERREPATPTIGFLARMIHGKGLTTLVDAFIALAKRETVPGVKLRVAGAKMPTDDAYLHSLQQKLAKENLTDRVTWEPNLTFEEKVTFLHEITLFSVPATYGEAFGLYIAEAQACGNAVVQPRHGAFPEILAATQGGVICEPDDPEALSQSLEELLLNHARRQQLGQTGRTQALSLYSSARMAEGFEQVLTSVVR